MAALRGITTQDTLANEDGQNIKRVRQNGASGPWIWVKRRGWITPDVDPTGAVDSTSTILTAAQSRVGACVALPDGSFRMNSGMTLPAGTALVGNSRGSNYGFGQFPGYTPNNVGTQIRAYGLGKLFTMQMQTHVEGLEIWYPSQATNATPTAYDYTFWCDSNMHGASIENVTCLNPYDFIWNNNNGLWLDKIVAAPLHKGVFVGRNGGVFNAHRVNFASASSLYTAGSTLTNWVQANGTAFSIDGAEEFNFTDCSAYGYNRGLEFPDNDLDGRISYGSWTGGGLDACNTCILVPEPTGLTLRALKMSNCGLVSLGAGSGYCIDFSDTSSNADRPVLLLNNVNCWGNYNAALRIGSSSRARVIWNGGTVQQYTNYAFRAPSTNAVVRLYGVGTSTTSRVDPTSTGDTIDAGGWTL
jgi:hypothetical protein